MQVGPSNHEEEEVPLATDTNISTDSEESYEEFMQKMDDKIEDDLQTLGKLIAANSPDTCSAEGDLSQLLTDTYAQYAVNCLTLVHIIFCALLSKGYQSLSRHTKTSRQSKTI